MEHPNANAKLREALILFRNLKPNDSLPANERAEDLKQRRETYVTRYLEPLWATLGPAELRNLERFTGILPN